MSNTRELSASFFLLLLLHITIANGDLTDPEETPLGNHTIKRNKPGHKSSFNISGASDISKKNKFYSDCTVESHGLIYDLTKLAEKNFWFRAESLDDNLEKIFLLSICHPIENITSCQNNSGVCIAHVNSSIIDPKGHRLKDDKSLNDISFITAGRLPVKELKVSHEGFIYYSYDSGQSCSEGYKPTTYSVELHLQCARSSYEESGGPLLMVTSSCNFIFLWTTKVACPKKIEATDDPCIKKFSNSDYPLNLHALHTDTFYSAYGINGSFEINICGPIKGGSCPNNTAICDISDPQKPKVLASSDNINFTWKKDALILSYKNMKTDLNSVSANIHLYCSRNVFSPRLFFLSNNSNVYNFSLYTINVCDPEPSDCVFEDEKLNRYDLRPLYKKEHNWEVGRKSENKTYHYMLNVCGPINPEKAVHCPPGLLGACQTSESTEGSRNIGYITSNPIVNKDGSITLMYTGGDPCRDGVLSSSTRVFFLCNNIGYPPVFLRVTESCEHIFEWHTPAACPVNVVLTNGCIISDPLFGHNFDLYPLRNVSGDYQVAGKGNESFNINFCGPLVTSCGAYEKAAVCHVGSGEKKSGGGAPAQLLFNDGTIVFKFSNGASGCEGGRWASQVLLLCSHDQNNSLGLQYSLSDEHVCMHHFVWYTSLACPPISDVSCIVQNGRITYDLTPLSNPEQNDVYIDREHTKKYVVNVCRSVVHSKESRCAYDAGACLIDLSHENKTLTLGRVGSGPYIERGSLKLRYDRGSSCNATHNHATIINFECSREQYLSYPMLTAEENCTTFFKWRSSYACPMVEPPPTSDSPSGNCTAVNPLTNYVFDMNSLKREKPFELVLRDGLSLLISACGPVKDPRCSQENVGACLVQTGSGSSSSAGRTNQALHFRNWSTYLIYKGGEKCLNGLERSTQISFICREDPDSKIVGPFFITDDDEACIFFVHWYLEKACERHISCFAQSSDLYLRFDLSPLIRHRDNYRIQDPDDPDSLYFINVCRPLNPVIGINCHPGSSSCLVRKNRKDKKPLGLGHPIINPTLVSTDGPEYQVHLMYSYGSPCPNNTGLPLSSRIIFVCNRLAGVGSPRILRKANDCQIQFEWETSVVCVPSKEEENDNGDCLIAYEAAKTNVNLGPLRHDHPYNVSHRNSYFLLNVCGGSSCTDGVAVCTTDGQSYGLSSKSSLRWDPYGHLLLSFYDDFPCVGALSGSLSTQISFECDLEAGFGTPKADPAMDDLECMALFIWPTNLTCLAALYPTPPSNPRNDSRISPDANSDEDAASKAFAEDDSSQHTWVSALIAGMVLTLVVAAFVYVVGRSAFGRRLYARAKQTLARKGDQTFILDDQL